MKDSSATQVLDWLLEHAKGCDQCHETLLACRADGPGLTDIQVIERCCRTGQPMVVQWLKKTLRAKRDVTGAKS